MQKFSNSECDLIILRCAGQGSISYDGPSEGYTQEIWVEFTRYLQLKNIIRLAPELPNGGYALTAYGISVADQGGLVEISRKREEDIRKADDLRASTVSTNDSFREINKHTRSFIAITAFCSILTLCVSFATMHYTKGQMKAQQTETELTRQELEQSQVRQSEYAQLRIEITKQKDITDSLEGALISVKKGIELQKKAK